MWTRIIGNEIRIALEIENKITICTSEDVHDVGSDLDFQTINVNAMSDNRCLWVLAIEPF
jgi:hypothetical protein